MVIPYWNLHVLTLIFWILCTLYSSDLRFKSHHDMTVWMNFFFCLNVMKDKFGTKMGIHSNVCQNDTGSKICHNPQLLWCLNEDVLLFDLTFGGVLWLATHTTPYAIRYPTNTCSQLQKRDEYLFSHGHIVLFYLKKRKKERKIVIFTVHLQPIMRHHSSRTVIRM